MRVASSVEHYLYINMRDRGCNCGFRYHDVPQDRAALDEAHQAHLAEVNVMTSGSLPRVAKPVMIMRSLRVPADLWEQAKAKADERQENISDVIREALERYVKRR